MAAEYGITCLSDVNGKVCGKAVDWFDYELGEREFYRGFVCDDHRISNQVEKLAHLHQAGDAVFCGHLRRPPSHNLTGAPGLHICGRLEYHLTAGLFIIGLKIYI
jgi:hypothetical protein